MIATKAVTPISSGGSTWLFEFLGGIALIGQGSVFTNRVLGLSFLLHVSPLCYPTQNFSSRSLNHCALPTW